MGTFQAIILGIIQGLTEFLPISSSGHLVLFQQFFGLKEPELYFDISVHLGTMVAVFIYFIRDIQAILSSVTRSTVLFFSQKASLSDLYQEPDFKLAILIVIGSVPTAIIGVLFKKISDQLFSSLSIVGVTLIITGLILWATRFVKSEGKPIGGFSAKDALSIGVMQGLAIIPGISRSGSTIAVGLFLGLNRETAARFSFLLSIPAIMGAAVLILKDISEGMAIPVKEMLIGGVTACVIGYLSLRFLVYIVKKGQMYFFAPYCFLVGFLILVWRFF